MSAWLGSTGGPQVYFYLCGEKTYQVYTCYRKYGKCCVYCPYIVHPSVQKLKSSQESRKAAWWENALQFGGSKQFFYGKHSSHFFFCGGVDMNCVVQIDYCL